MKMTHKKHTDDATIEARNRRTNRHGRAQPAVYICMEKAGYGTCYAVRQTKKGVLFVDVVDAEKAVSLIDDSRHVLDDGGIVYPNLDDDDRDEMFIEMDVDVDVGELSGHPFEE